MAKKQPSGAANSDVSELLEVWGAHVDPELLILALTHRSFANEVGDLPNNERLEWLGDSVLSIVTTDELYHRFPDVPESELARLRAAVVSQKPLAEVASAIGLGQYVLLGVGENKTGGREKASILSDVLEALIGATYLSSGLKQTRKVLLKHLSSVMKHAGDPEAKADWKTPLHRYVRDEDLGEVTFEVEGSGPDHDRSFKAEVKVDGHAWGSATSGSKKAAENAAARVALENLRARPGANGGGVARTS